MTSAIVTYRTAVVNAIQAAIPALTRVDWYDAIFDEQDVQDWTLSCPCAFVAVRDIQGYLHQTGEINLSVDMVVVVVTQDVTDRDSDPQSWNLIEAIMTLVNYNTFGLTTAAIPDNLAMSRLREPELRRMGVALGLVEWTAGLTIGTNMMVADITYTNPYTGQPITQFPRTTMVGTTTIGGIPAETVDLNPDGA